jgi:integrase
LTGKDSYLSGSTRDAGEVEKIRTRLLARVDAQRSPAAKVTLGFALDAWFDVHEAEATTLETYRSYADRTIRPALGDTPIAKISPRMLEGLYAQLRRCRVRCDGRAFVEHRVEGEHECREISHRRKRAHDCATSGCRVLECAPHVCRPMSPATIRQIHSVISGALSTAVRWDWIGSNPAALAKKPRQPRPQPKPPSAAQAARIIAAAWESDQAWGTLVWLVMVTGIRRGELMALRFTDVDLDSGVLEVRRSYVYRAGVGVEKDTKTHQIRRIALDETTVELLRAHRDQLAERCAALGFTLAEDAFVFSYQPDHARPCNPDAVSHRYVRMCAALGIDSHLHALRHYSATELIAAGIDVRTVAGRLGHGGGGTTTLKVYAAWVAESDRKAAAILSSRLGHPGRRRESGDAPSAGGH